MYGPNVGLEIGKSALLAEQLMLNITGNNIANVNTPGYSRQRPILSTNLSLKLPFGMVGTGVDAIGVQQYRSVFVDQQYRVENQKLGKLSLMNQSWQQVESIFTEPQDTSLSANLDQFWTSWQDLANDPTSDAARTAVREQGSILVNSFHHLSQQLSDFRKSLDTDITSLVDQVNSMSTELAQLNQSISSAELGGTKANDLRDKRDYIIDQLSQLVDVSVTEKPTGDVTVYLGSMALVDGSSHLDLATRVENEDSIVKHVVFLKGTGTNLENTGGKLEGLIEARDIVAVDQQNKLDILANGLAKAVNQVHNAGYGANGTTGIDFFSSETTGAADIELDGRILQDTGLIAAGGINSSGDNSVALAIAGLKDQSTLKGGQSTFNDYYNSIIGEIGLKSKESDDLQKNQEALLAQLDNSKQSVEGVSLDEEMANMIQYQHAYEAAARLISTMDSILDTLINGMGAK
jgi:flagellar hook-associated protein 1 FlgK